MPITLSEGQEVELTVTLNPIVPKLATLYGKITDANTREPIEGVLIEVANVASGYSDTTGNFRITDILPGTYVVTISKEGYETVVK